MTSVYLEVYKVNMTTPAAPTVHFDDATLADPYPTYARLRATPGLVRHAREKYFLVARYDDIREAAMRTEDFSSRIVEVLVASLRLGPAFEAWMARLGPVDVLAVVDAPSHLVHRKLTTRYFTRDTIAAAVGRAQGRVDRRLEAFVAAGGGDFAQRIAEPLPVELALEMVGFPQADSRWVKKRVDHAVALLAGTLPRTGLAPVFVSAFSLYAYSLARFEWARRRGGTGAPLGDAIVRAADEGILGTREAASIVMQILIAGADSTTSLLGSAARILAEDPALAERLRTDPSLVPAFVEECLRLESPFQGHFRVVVRETELAGIPLHPGDRLMLLWASGNRDENAFESPETLDLGRRRERKPQLAFGQGIHLCVGAGLARSAAASVIQGLLARTSSITLASRSLTHKPSGFVRTLTSVPLRVRARVSEQEGAGR